VAEENTPDNQAAQDNQQPKEQFAVQKIYVKDISFESPNSPHIFMEQATTTPPQYEMSYNIQEVGNNMYEVALNMSLSLKVEEKTIFLVELKQAGIFALVGFPEDKLKYMLNGVCPNVLYPYIRETVSELIVRGGFQPLYLGVVNFEAMYMQRVQQEQAKAQAGEVNTSVN